jgi:hypothetical protein
VIRDLDDTPLEPSRRHQVAALSLVSAGAAVLLLGVLLLTPIGARGPLVTAPVATGDPVATAAPVTVTFATVPPEMAALVARGPGSLVPKSCESRDVPIGYVRDGTTVVLIISDARPRVGAPQAISALPVQASRSTACESTATPRTDLRILAPY